MPLLAQSVDYAAQHNKSQTAVVRVCLTILCASLKVCGGIVRQPDKIVRFFEVKDKKHKGQLLSL